MTLLGRFSPAGAGNTHIQVERGVLISVQPRRRGEHRTRCTTVSAPAGSAPQARGTRFLGRIPGADLRFSPAGAGNTRSHARSLKSVPVQPRRRGEHTVQTDRRRKYDGSAPQARGTLIGGNALIPYSRFSPAGAGNTHHPRGRHAPCPVQPRRRGEHSSTGLHWSQTTGSAPQARGTRDAHLGRRHPSRFSPAGAGNTLSVGIRPCRQTVQPRRRGEHNVVRSPEGS